MPRPNNTRKKGVQFANTNPWNVLNLNNNAYPNSRTRNNRKVNLKLRSNQAYRGVLNSVRPRVKMEVNLQLPRTAGQKERTVLTAYETWKYGYYDAIQKYPEDLQVQKDIQGKLLNKTIKDATYAILEDAATTEDVHSELVQPVYSHIPEDFRVKILEFADKQLKTSRRYNRFSTPVPSCNNGVNWNAPFEEWTAPNAPPPPNSRI